jgi:hypothetical protein
LRVAFIILIIVVIDKIKKTEMEGTCIMYGESRGAYRVVVEKPEGRRPLARPRRRWGVTLKWIFDKWEGGTWTGSILLCIGTGGGLL